MFSPFIINLSITVIISISIIVLLHYLWEYMKDNYSTRKVKDLVNTQIEKYKALASTNIEDKGSLSKDILTEDEKTNMQEDLQQYLLTLQDYKID